MSEPHSTRQGRQRKQKTRHTKDDTLYDLWLLWPTDNPANIAQRMGYQSIEGLLRSLSRWPEGKVWEKRLQAADTLQRGRGNRNKSSTRRRDQ